MISRRRPRSSKHSGQQSLAMRSGQEVRQGLDMMVHRQLLNVAQARKMALGMKIAKLLDRAAVEQIGASAVELLYKLVQGLRELAGRVGGRVFRRRNEMIDIHHL